MCATIVRRICADLCRWRRSDSAAPPPPPFASVSIVSGRHSAGPMCCIWNDRIPNPCDVFLRFYSPLLHRLQGESGIYQKCAGSRCSSHGVCLLKKHYSAALIVSVHLMCTKSHALMHVLPTLTRSRAHARTLASK